MPELNDGKTVGDVIGDIQNAPVEGQNTEIEPLDIEPPEPEPNPGDTSVQPEPYGVQPNAEAVKKAKERAAYHQAIHQKTMDALNKISPRIAQQVKSKVDDYRRYRGEENERQEPQYRAPESPKDERNVLDLTVEEFINLQKKERESTLETLRRENSQHQLNEEYAQSSDLVERYVQQLGFTEDEVRRANQEAYSLGIDLDRPGGYSRLARAMIKELNWIEKERGSLSSNAGGNQRNDRLAALNTVRQPGGGAPPAKPEKSFREHRLAEMDAVSDRRVSDILKK